jgi:fructan beta-fructosidase
MNPPNRRRMARWISWLAPVFLSVACAVSAARAYDRPDVVVADFEGDDYGGWSATGAAFGRAPARGTLPNQMAVSGFLGHGLVNSFHGGDASTGTLTSPPLVIERRHLNFLIGGGAHAGETCLNLLVGGSVVRTATGPNDRPGGSEALDWASWDVSEFLGKTAVLQVVDRQTGGWGHINVDQIVQSDRKRGLAPASRDFVAEKRYLHLPVAGSAPTRRVRIEAGGKTVREFDIKLAEGEPDFRVFSDVAAWKGQTLRVEATLPADSKGLDAIIQADEVPDARGMYREALRPQFHFTSRRGWLNDPNGLVWQDGEYHLFYQHNPYGWDWGNMHWGHAVSPDLVHWTELPEALYPRRYGDWCFSGSAVVDARNTSGFGAGGRPPMVAAFSSTGRGECIVYSNDRGRTWTEFEGNPVVKHTGRDPRLLWHEPSKRWVMAVYDETGSKRGISFHSSPDLKAWTFESRIEGFYECPDLFALPVEGQPGKSLWVLYAADGAYMLGDFDGRRFTPESPTKHRLWYGHFYAAQTFSNTPDGRRIQIGWGNGITFPSMPFNQQMTVPCELTLKQTREGVRMFARPVAELAALRTPRAENVSTPGSKVSIKLGGGDGRLAEVRAATEFAERPRGKVTLSVRGVTIAYDRERGVLSCGSHSAPLLLPDGKLRLRILVDVGSVEVFANDGRVAISHGLTPPEVAPPIEAAAEGNTTPLVIRVDLLKPAWR